LKVSSVGKAQISDLGLIRLDSHVTSAFDRVVFMGTPAFALPVMSALLKSNYNVVAVYSQPDKVAGRGNKVSVPPVKEYAIRHGLSVFQPDSLRSQSVQEQLMSLSPDLIVVAAYGLILPKTVLDVPVKGCLNLHPSLLPKYRGPTPVASAILNGESITGVTIITMDEGMDTGPIVATKNVPIEFDETSFTLTTKLFELGAELLVSVLPDWLNGSVSPREQDSSAAVCTRKFVKEDGYIDWSRSAVQIERSVRAFQPWPGCYTRWNGKLVKILDSSVTDSEIMKEPNLGVVLAMGSDDIGISTSSGILEVHQLQVEGKRPVDSREFILGNPCFIGAKLG